jgi:hypothetical protein
MARPMTDTTEQGYESEEITFQITVERVIGEVTTSRYGTVSPIEAAMSLIGREGEPGRYSFPLSDGRTRTVTVEDTEQL